MSQGSTIGMSKSSEVDVPELEESVLAVVDEDSKSSKQTRELIPDPLLGFAGVFNLELNTMQDQLKGD